MIPETQAIEIINEQFPEINLSEQPDKPFKKFDVITNYAVELLNKNEHNKLSKFFKLIGDLYAHCDNKIKMCIENVLIYKLATRIELCSQRAQLLKLIPFPIKAVMQKQFYSASI
jgi:hypothetical protein